ncbi:uncharacterized protein [Nicotiana tomentosiformis]|uniref:uncharacterized protein n=1 Tax=Nicotiana tomentosiformis TaxID=4098 RepID=UPI00388C5AE1
MGKKGEIIGVGKVGKTDLIDGLKHNLISVSQLCDRANMVAFTSTKCFVINLTIDKIVLHRKRVNNIYVVDMSTLSENEFTCLSVLDNDPLLWHKRLGHASLSQLNKLVSKDLVIGLPNIKFKEDKEHDDEAIWLVRNSNETTAQTEASPEKGTCPSTQGNLTEGTELRGFDPQTSREPVYEYIPQQQNIEGISRGSQLFVKPYKYQSSHPIENIITDPTSGIKSSTKPKDKSVIGTKWEFRNKLDEDRTIIRNKARLVVQGYSQGDGINYDETFDPITILEAIRLLIAFAAFMEFTLHQMDVKSDFLNGYLKEKVFVKQSHGFEIKECPNHVYKVDKSYTRELSVKNLVHRAYKISDVAAKIAENLENRFVLFGMIADVETGRSGKIVGKNEKKKSEVVEIDVKGKGEERVVGSPSPTLVSLTKEAGAMIVLSEEISDNEETMNESMELESQEIGDGSGDRSAADRLVRLRKRFHEPVPSLAKIDECPDLLQKVSDSYNQKKKNKVGKTAGKGMGGTKRKIESMIVFEVAPLAMSDIC